uniref:Aspartic peptidase DDI1-type domain-containing protein n=1 Tax=Lactuca sativa TaxID=4236 RepID=A0A9R1VJ71_LACSA|nr:hypothetical protein LSAT_V11C500254800 [Lactuca sativa]
MFTRFVAVSEKRHNDTDAKMKEQRNMLREHQAMMKDQQNMLRNQQASIHNIEKQLGQLAKQINQRAPGGLPSNTKQNPRMAHVNAITTNSEPIHNPLTFVQKNHNKVQTEEVSSWNSSKPDSTRRVANMDSTSRQPVNTNCTLLKPYRPSLPFPSRAMPDEQIQEYRRFMEHIKALQVNIPFVETILQTPKYGSLLKNLFTTRRNIEEVAEIVLSELPKKRGDLGSITVPCQFGNIMITRALTDSGASINIMPYSFFQKLNLPVPKPIPMKIHLADKTIIHPMGVCEDLLIKIYKLVFPVDFIILDMEEDSKVPIILGRPFFNTACALVDMCESMLTLRVGDDLVIFEVEKKKKPKESKEDKVSLMILDDEVLERELAYLQEDNPNQFLLSLEENSDAKGDLEEIERLIKEADCKESLTSVEDSLTHRVVSANSTSTCESSQSNGNDNLQAIRTLCEPDVHVLHDYLKNPLKKNKTVKYCVNFEDAHLSFLEAVVEDDAAVQEEDRGSLEDKGDLKTFNGDNHNSSIESHMLDQEEMSIKSKRTKPRAIVSTSCEDFTFKVPYSVTTKEAIKKDKKGRETIKREKEEVEKNKHGKG